MSRTRNSTNISRLSNHHKIDRNLATKITPGWVSSGEDYLVKKRKDAVRMRE